MTRVLSALLSHPWAIRAEALEIIAAIAERAIDDPGLVAAREAWLKRDPEGVFAAATPMRRLPGTSRALFHEGVAVLPVFGPIFPRANLFTEMSGATSIAGVEADLNAALADGEVRAILLAMDSPGGAVSGVDAFADRIHALRGRIPVWAHVQGLGASAAYWIASSASRVEADRSAILGSIGVLFGTTVQKGPDSNNRVFVEITSSGAPDKRLDADSEEGRAKIKAMLDEIEAQFVGDVARGRATTRDRVLSDFGRGGVKVAASALEAGMIDAVAGFDATLARLAASVAKSRPAPQRAALQSRIRSRESGRT